MNLIARRSSVARLFWAAVLSLGLAALVGCATPKAPKESVAVPLLRLDMDPSGGASASTPGESTLVATLPVGAQALPPYRFNVGDEFDLRVPDAAQFDMPLKVRQDGKVSVPLIGTLHVQGRTPEDVQDELRERLTALSGGSGNKEYLIQPNDELEVKFPYVPNLNEAVKVRPDGKVQLQMVGMVQVEGLSPEELQSQLKQRYAKYLRVPEVSVVMRNFANQKVRVAGGMGRAGLGDLRPNIIAKSAQATQVFVGGEVARPGVLTYRPGLTVIQALVESGGHLPTGDISQMVLLRRGANNLMEVHPLKFGKDYMSRPDKDVQLQPFDVVLLPRSGIATLGDQLNQYVFNLFPILRNSSLGIAYDLRNNP